MRWFKEHYHRYMIRPIVTKTITRTLIGLVIVLLWDKYVNVERVGVSRLAFGLGAIGLILMAGAWFSYLHLDGLTPVDTAKKHLGIKNKKKKTKRSTGGDIADYLDEEIVPFAELEEDEKAACQMAAFFLSGAVLVIAGILVPLML
jgi:F0F1-type ATP synthase assembly protein I